MTPSGLGHWVYDPTADRVQELLSDLVIRLRTLILLKTNQPVRYPDPMLSDAVILCYDNTRAIIPVSQSSMQLSRASCPIVIMLWDDQHPRNALQEPATWLAQNTALPDDSSGSATPLAVQQLKELDDALTKVPTPDVHVQHQIESRVHRQRAHAKKAAGLQHLELDLEPHLLERSLGLLAVCVVYCGIVVRVY
ncbi:hypothetical protein NM208_g16269 [Fusarium decemcellulare]|uniref:Uncharacterized protein n=1 Tax=Fusarium decemcellulare TaxID=57161 RepID=A0ACC1RAN8_9HYPO|nr:hypothetical protein NM208_g16269 [Fusarium decemcellulare]